MNIPSQLKYTKSHEWVRLEGKEVITGITDFAQHELGDIVFVELPKVSQKINIEDPCAVVESVKAASDVYAPISGKVIRVNGALSLDTGLVNKDPYGEGWFYAIEPSDPEQLKDLLSSEDYQQLSHSEA